MPVAVVVLLGRDAITAASTNSAPTLSAYVSGDARSTAECLVQLGAALSRIASGSCAHTAWETPPAPPSGCASITRHPLAADHRPRTKPCSCARLRRSGSRSDYTLIHNEAHHPIPGPWLAFRCHPACVRRIGR